MGWRRAPLPPGDYAPARRRPARRAPSSKTSSGRGKEVAANGLADTITYFGPDLRIAPGGRWELNVEYLERRDDNPFFEPGRVPEVVTRGGFGELLFFPAGEDGRWALYALYNRIDSDDPAVEVEDLAVGASYLYRRNVRCVAELGHAFGPGDERERISAGVIVAF